MQRKLLTFIALGFSVSLITLIGCTKTVTVNSSTKLRDSATSLAKDTGKTGEGGNEGRETPLPEFSARRTTTSLMAGEGVKTGSGGNDPNVNRLSPKNSDNKNE